MFEVKTKLYKLRFVRKFVERKIFILCGLSLTKAYLWNWLKGNTVISFRVIAKSVCAFEFPLSDLDPNSAPSPRGNKFLCPFHSEIYSGLSLQRVAGEG